MKAAKNGSSTCHYPCFTGGKTMSCLPEHFTLGLSPFILSRARAHCGDSFSESQLLFIKGGAKRASKIPEHVFEGYRDGVVLVKLPTSLTMYNKTIELQPDDKLVTLYESRVPGEEPRKNIYVQLTLSSSRIGPAKSVFAVLYRKDVLAEDGENIEEDWAVVALITSSLDEPEPMDPDTLIHNHFHLSGGTHNGWDSDRFEQELEISYRFWKNKARLMLVDEKEIDETEG